MGHGSIPLTTRIVGVPGKASMQPGLAHHAPGPQGGHFHTGHPAGNDPVDANGLGLGGNQTARRGKPVSPRVTDPSRFPAFRVLQGQQHCQPHPQQQSPLSPQRPPEEHALHALAPPPAGTVGHVVPILRALRDKALHRPQHFRALFPVLSAETARDPSWISIQEFQQGLETLGFRITTEQVQRPLHWPNPGRTGTIGERGAGSSRLGI